MTRQTATRSSERRRGIHLSERPTSAIASAELVSGLDRGKERPVLLGHRGARPRSPFGLAVRAENIPPENSLACFEYALAHGCDGFEFDVRVTRDGRLVLCHNAWVRGYKVSASFFESLCSRGGIGLACLEDVLQAFGDRAYLDIEAKVPGGEELIVKAIRRCRPRCGYLVSSFLPEVLRRLHSLDPKLPLGYVCNRSYNISLWRKLPIEVFLPHYKLITQTLVDQVHDRGLQVFTWTVNHEKELRQLAAWGVDGLISDDPRLLRRTLQPADGFGAKRTAKNE